MENSKLDYAWQQIVYEKNNDRLNICESNFWKSNSDNVETMNKIMTTIYKTIRSFACLQIDH